MKRFSLNLIFLIVISIIGKLKAQSAIQSIDNVQDVRPVNIFSVENRDLSIQKENKIFKSTVKEIDESLFFKISNRSDSSTIKLKNTRHKIGFITGYGGQKKINSSYNYEIVFFQFQYYYSLLKKRTWGLEVLLQPQYNITKYKNSFYGEKKLKGYEFGLNMGFLARKNIVKDFLSSYLLISAGPHYVSGTPERQADGFIFSDNFLAGISVKVFKSVYLDIRGGFRHISNAGFKEPNKGVDNLIINGGFFLPF